jgi:hypothetical protein
MGELRGARSADRERLGVCVIELVSAVGGTVTRFLFVLVLFLHGCALQQLNNDMTNNRFLEYTPIPVSFSGAYSAAMGPYILTYKIARDGTGLSCYYQNGTVVVHKAKVFSRDGTAYRVILEAGTTGAIHALPDGTYSLESYGKQYKLLPDNDLTLANLNCKEKLL